MTQPSNRRTLLDISDDVIALDDLLAEVEGDISDPEVERTVSEWFAELESDLETKVDNYVALIQTMEARAKVRREESARLAKRARTDESSASWLRQRLIDALHRTDRGVVETPRFRVSVAKVGGLQAVEITGDVPCEFRKVVSEPDPASIRTALLEGRELSFAHLKPRGERLVIR